MDAKTSDRESMIQSLRTRVDRYKYNEVAWVNCPIREARAALAEIDRLRGEQPPLPAREEEPASAVQGDLLELKP
ncbi:hypothetical protein GCM10011390_20880 [Aureimonas endophytica]|uniref:Uncharacterized protein n=1 Tax=Aureimonas endophytica TaxID=2027858 RepID=A0A916ZK50_9HYPH|nr:hypothetical protein [Aureimonas endophytica]GGE01864.1 hypothetical protein GCM10011390_20880 [Aureimonas endophytica]